MSPELESCGAYPRQYTFLGISQVTGIIKVAVCISSDFVYSSSTLLVLLVNEYHLLIL